MAFDYKKAYKEFYLPPQEPEIVTVPEMHFISVEGKGNPNDPDGEYAKALGMLYGIAYTIKMSKKGDHRIDGYFDYVVPPLEGFWWMEGKEGMDYQHKELFCWVSVIRLPDFVTEEDLAWAKEEATVKKKQDFSAVSWLSLTEGLCVQCMHVGSFDSEPASTAMMDSFAAGEGYHLDFSAERRHHEIYLSDARKTAAEKMKTVIRHPIA